MRFAVFADIHGNLPAFEAMLADMRRQGEFDQIWCLGDIAALGGQPQACIQKLAELRQSYGKEKVKIIGGNTDRYLVTGERFPFSPPAEAADFDAYRSSIVSMSTIYEWNMSRLTWDNFALLKAILGQELRQQVEGYGHVIGFHAIPGDDESMSLHPDSPDEEAHDALLDRAGRLALCGHTHLAMQRRLGSWQVVNPGSVGLSSSKPGLAEWICLEWRDDQLEIDWRAAPYDVKTALRQWEALDYPQLDWIRQRLKG